MFYMRTTYKYALSGGAAGVANGLFGAGGGMLLVPLLTRWAGLPDKEAFATSISIILPLCLTSLGVYCLQGQLDFLGAVPYLIGGFFGGLLGGMLFGRVPDKLLHRGLGLLILYGGLRSLLW
jgi:hypothetical protein